MPIDCHLPQADTFSLVPTFKQYLTFQRLVQLSVDTTCRRFYSVNSYPRCFFIPNKGSVEKRFGVLFLKWNPTATALSWSPVVGLVTASSNDYLHYHDISKTFYRLHGYQYICLKIVPVTSLPLQEDLNAVLLLYFVYRSWAASSRANNMDEHPFHASVEVKSTSVKGAQAWPSRGRIFLHKSDPYG